MNINKYVMALCVTFLFFVSSLYSQIERDCITSDSLKIDNFIFSFSSEMAIDKEWEKIFLYDSVNRLSSELIIQSNFLSKNKIFRGFVTLDINNITNKFHNFSVSNENISFPVGEQKCYDGYIYFPLEDYSKLSSLSTIGRFNIKSNKIEYMKGVEYNNISNFIINKDYLFFVLGEYIDKDFYDYFKSLKSPSMKNKYHYALYLRVIGDLYCVDYNDESVKLISKSVYHDLDEYNNSIYYINDKKILFCYDKFNKVNKKLAFIEEYNGKYDFKIIDKDRILFFPNSLYPAPSSTFIFKLSSLKSTIIDEDELQSVRFHKNIFALVKREAILIYDKTSEKPRKIIKKDKNMFPIFIDENNIILISHTVENNHLNIIKINIQ